MVLPYIERSLFASRLFGNLFAVNTIQLVSSLVAALPYIALFIALTLIVDGEVGDGSPHHLIGGDIPEELTTTSSPAG